MDHYYNGLGGNIKCPHFATLIVFFNVVEHRVAALETKFLAK